MANDEREHEERELVAAVLAGDRDAFTELVRRYERLVARLLPRAIADPRDREELCQDVFLRVHRGLRSFQHESRLSTWIARIAYRISIDALRRRRLETSEAVDVATSDASALDHVLEEERQESVWRAVDALPLPQRTAVTLFYIEELPVEEIAAVMDVPAGTVKSHLYRARQILKVKLK